VLGGDARIFFTGAGTLSAVSVSSELLRRSREKQGRCSRRKTRSALKCVAVGRPTLFGVEEKFFSETENAEGDVLGRVVSVDENTSKGRLGCRGNIEGFGQRIFPTSVETTADAIRRKGGGGPIGKKTGPAGRSGRKFQHSG